MISPKPQIKLCDESIQINLFIYNVPSFVADKSVITNTVSYILTRSWLVIKLRETLFDSPPPDCCHDLPNFSLSYLLSSSPQFLTFVFQSQVWRSISKARPLGQRTPARRVLPFSAALSHLWQTESYPTFIKLIHTSTSTPLYFTTINIY